ncbi:Thioredoxin F-type, chloroplastic [Ananas comosus]|uniref:Thioredoxin F-type, chloroplastic n=1 Tax=Ananas comosus TaxID=4615 RepID=A0A199W5K3_ANACO|nr:Thioredoxin F-type, chloroplastic [Ananas comosus]
MALGLSLSSSPSLRSATSLPSSSSLSTTSIGPKRRLDWAGPRRASGSVAASKEASAARSPEPARAGLEAAAAAAAAATAEAVVGQVTEVGKDTFWPIVEAAEDKIVVLDMYTQWYESCPNYVLRSCVLLLLLI